MGHTRQVNVLLPDEYADPANAAKRYPVLYLLDGGTG
jgi:predicted alpha/beta superfamily hydrolase